MLEYLFLALMGCGLGVVTGIIPGLHVNTVAVIGFGTYLSLGLDPLGFVVILTALSITHAFLEYLPAIFLGAPQEDTALSVLPAHRLFMQGRALEAVKLTATGSLMGLTLGLLLFLPALYLIPLIYNASRGVISYVLILLVLLLLLHEKAKKKILWAFLIFLLSGWLGVIALDKQEILSSNEILFPVFVGLFGMSNLLDSLKSRVHSAVPQDEYVKVDLEPGFIGSGFLGALSGAIIGVLPAISPSQMGALISERFELDGRNFLVFLSAINTSDAIYSMLAIYTIQNPRSGVAVIAQKVLEIDYNTVLLLVGVMAFSAFFATVAQIELGKRMSGIVSRLDYRKLCFASLMFILSLVYLFTGIFGLLLAILSTIIGLLPIYSGVSRTHLMGVLLVPTILFFFGVQI
jgi:putative membrane protein